jgi:hypothetical protein
MYVYVSITKLKSRRKMSSNTARVMSVSLDQLEKSEVKMRSTERQRAKTQSNNAYCLLAALEQSYADYIPDIEQISKLTEEDSWNEVKANLVFLEQAARNFREIQNIHERLLRKTETAIRHAQKNVGKSLRRSVRIRDIKEAKCARFC